MITSTSNARIKRLVNLKKKRKLRDEESVLPGRRNPHVQGSAARQVKRVYVSESFYKKEKDNRKRSPERL